LPKFFSMNEFTPESVNFLRGVTFSAGRIARNETYCSVLQLLFSGKMPKTQHQKGKPHPNTLLTQVRNKV